jgi:hypothetical protein
MKYRTLGSSGLAVSKLALGTMYFGSQNTEEEAFALLDAFLEAGGNLLDTSKVYSGSLSEQIIGRWLAARPSEVTDRVVLTSKGRYTTGPDVDDLGLSRRHLTAPWTPPYTAWAWRRSISTRCTAGTRTPPSRRHCHSSTTRSAPGKSTTRVCRTSPAGSCS